MKKHKPLGSMLSDPDFQPEEECDGCGATTVTVTVASFSWSTEILGEDDTEGIYVNICAACLRSLADKTDEFAEVVAGLSSEGQETVKGHPVKRATKIVCDRCELPPIYDSTTKAVDTALSFDPDDQRVRIPCERTELEVDGCNDGLMCGGVYVRILAEEPPVEQDPPE